MPLIARLARRIADRHAASAPAAIAGTDEGDGEGGSDRAAGCGWFDSSFDLQAGLTVTEAAPGDDADIALASAWMCGPGARANAQAGASIR